jgi:low affinity Fe/Cu permease
MNPKIFRLLRLYELRKSQFIVLPREIHVIDNKIDELLVQSRYLSEKLLVISAHTTHAEIQELEDIYDKLEVEQFSALMTGLEILS